MTTQPGAPIGDVQPVYVSVANGSDVPRSIAPSQIFALNDSGARVAPLPPGEAARQAGGSGELKAALTSGAVGGVAEGALGAGLGAAIGSVVNGFSGFSGAASGAIVGAAFGGGKLGSSAECKTAPIRPISRPTRSSERWRCRVARSGTISRSAAMCFFPRAAITKSSFCWSTRRRATPK